jgi:hypothetical protein
MTDDFENTSYQHRKELQVNLRAFLTAMKPDYFVTLNPNIEMTLQSRAGCRSISAPRFFKDYHQRLDRKLFGNTFYLNQLDKRTLFFAFPEHINSNLHFHMPIWVPHREQVKFEIYAQPILHTILPGASIHIARVETLTDQRKISFYSCKEAIFSENFENFVISTEFSNVKYQRPACSLSVNT